MTGQLTAAPPRSWLYFTLYPGDVGLLDATVLDVVAPLVATHCDAAERWFFLRYVDAAGPHVRLRFLCTPGTADQLALLRQPLRRQVSELSRRSGRRPAPPLGGSVALQGPGRPDVHLDLYEPELAKWGGAECMPVAEAVFQTSSEVAIPLVTRLDGSVEARLALGVLVTSRLLDRLPMAEATRRTFLGTHFAWWSGSAADGGSRAQLLAGSAELVAPRVSDRLASLLPDADVLRLVDRFIDAVSDSLSLSNPAQKPLFLVFHHLHLMLNRLGIAPFEEAAVSLLTRERRT